jgi:prepilin-type N-terminal cleavage/methylation domain-containing protein
MNGGRSETARRAMGFSLIELLVVVALFVTLAALAVPALRMTDSARIDGAAREVERELQMARLRAVTVNHAIQLRFNCPGAGMYRMVEAAATWPESGRCDQTRYPYPPAPNAAYLTPPMPRYDGPVRYLAPGVVLSPAEPGLVLQFMPDGRTTKVVGGVSQLMTSMQVTLTYRTRTKSVAVNGLGRIQLQ